MFVKIIGSRIYKVLQYGFKRAKICQTTHHKRFEIAAKLTNQPCLLLSDKR